MVVFFDIDGTLVDEQTQIIPESAVRAVRQLKQRGHVPVVNTGRPLGHIDRRIREMDFSGWICSCGMEIFLDGKWLYRRFPDEELCRYVVNSVRECRMQVLYEDSDALYRDGAQSDGPACSREEQRLRARGMTVREIEQVPGMRFQKFVTHDAPGCQRIEFLRRMDPWFTCIDRGGGMVEYVKKGCSKAGGMQVLMEHLGVSREQTLAIGDSTNDLPMFSAAGHTACMGGGMRELKAKSEYITASVLDDGVEKALRHFRLI